VTAPRPAAVGPAPDRLLALSEAGARSAATALSQILGRSVRLEVSWARAIPLEEVPAVAGGASRVVCALSLRVYGEARGNLLLVLSKDQIPLFLDLLVGDGGAGGTGAGEISPIEESALLEVANILAGAYLNALSRILGLSLLPSIPDLAVDMAGAVTDFLLIELLPLTSTATVLANEVIEPASGLRVQILFLPDPAALPILIRDQAPGGAGRPSP
jgi:chemotaxis protein CheC